MLHEPRGAGLHRAIRLRPGGRPLRDGVDVHEGVGEERPDTPRVVIGGIEHHPLTPTQLEYGIAHIGGGRTITKSHTESSGEFGVADGSRQRPEGQLEGHRKDHVAAGVRLEARCAVGETAIPRGDDLAAPRDAVVRRHAGNGVGDLLAIGADVLDRSGSGEPGYAGECLEAGPLLHHRARDEVIPRLARGDGDPGTRTGIHRHLDTSRADEHDCAWHALVRHDDIAAAAQDRERLTRGVRGADGLEEFGVGLGNNHAVGGSAGAQGGEARQG